MLALPEQKFKRIEKYLYVPARLLTKIKGITEQDWPANERCWKVCIPAGRKVKKDIMEDIFLNNREVQVGKATEKIK